MEKQNSNEYGQTDPDFIDQNTLVDGNSIQSDDQYKRTINTETIPEFVEGDPDYIDQETLVDNDNYARDEDPYRYEEKFTEDLNTEIDIENNSSDKSEETEDQDKTLNKETSVSNNNKQDDLNKDDE
jgi:hypothetical protein